MRSSLGWCLDPEFCERKKTEHNYIRKTNVVENFARIREQVTALQAQGLNGRQIAFRLGIGRDQVYRALRAAGVGGKVALQVNANKPNVHDKFGGK